MSSQLSNDNSHQHLLTRPEYKNAKENFLETRAIASRSFYIKRSLVLFLAPLILTGYYCFIWRFFLYRDLDNAVKYGIPGERWIFYSWFIVGVFALEWSKYGLVGAECAALQSSCLGPKNMVGLLNYSGSTWSGPGGWMLSFTRFVNSADRKQGYTGWYGVIMSLGWGMLHPSNWLAGMKRILKSLNHYRLWYLLSFTSLSFYVGLPLSGLTMELSDGFVRINSTPDVVGRKWEDIHIRDWEGYPSAVNQAWGIGSPAILPGIGIIYTPKYVRRDIYSGLTSVPNTLPMDDGLPEMFLAPQARTPVSGKAWGLRVSYNCSIVERKSDFSLLPRQSFSPCNSGNLPDEVCIHQYASLTSKSHNVHGYVEVAQQEKGQNMYTTYDGEEPSTFDSNSASRGDYFEYILWQLRLEASYSEVEDFNDTIIPVIQDMASPFKESVNGSWDVDDRYFDSRSSNPNIKNKVRKLLNNTEVKVLYIAPPIGLRCVAVSTLGDAILDPRTSTFSSFEQRVPEKYTTFATEVPVRRLGVTVSQILSSNYINIFSSINSRIMNVNSNSVAYSGFATPKDLQKTAMLAYGTEALQLMYDGKYGFEGSWKHQNLSSTAKDKIITPGEISPYVSLITFGIWALGSLSMAVFYGFRKRRAETLDGFSFYRLGAHHSSQLREEENFFTAKEPHQVQKLWELSGESWAW